VDAVFYSVALNAISMKKKQKLSKESRPTTKPKLQHGLRNIANSKYQNAITVTENMREKFLRMSDRRKKRSPRRAAFRPVVQRLSRRTITTVSRHIFASRRRGPVFRIRHQSLFCRIA
jgi:hypothetical protein